MRAGSPVLLSSCCKGALAITLFLPACGGLRSPAPPLLPPVVAESWKMKESVVQPVSSAPENVRRLGLKRAERATYEGAGTITADVYELTSSAGGLELVQTWRPAADTVFFYKETYFAVVKWERAEKSAVTAFVRDLEKRLGERR
ncbi:MAG: hypothetical protein EXQ52_12155 [Bryobacterales bacterium]|nr:hypothetical protein [Bryobacterales bacterium]